MDTKFQKKHESDMTSKEKRQLEREKISSMQGMEKLEYILSYYKFHILVVIILVCAAVGLVKWAGTLQDENYIYTLVIDAPTDGEYFMEDFKRARGDEDEHHKYILDTGVYRTPDMEGNKGLDANARMKLTTLVGAGVADVFICPESVYEEYSKGEEALLYQISDLMGEEFVQENADICEADAIRVEDSKVLEKYGLLNGEPAYLMVFQYSAHPEIAKEFIEYVVE